MSGLNGGVLILEKQRQFWLEAIAKADKDSFKVTLHNLLLEDADKEVPTRIINTVLRTKTPLVLNDATREGRFANDPYILNKQPKSVLGQPMMYRGRMTGVVYLENKFISNAFTSERLTVLKLLSTQMAISLENANTMATLDAKVVERTTQLNDKIEELIQTRQELVQSEKMASLGRLVAGFAHELNTPLGVAVGTASTLHDNAEAINQLLEQEEVDEEELVSTLSTVKEAANLTLSNLKRASGLVNSFKRTAIDQSSEEVRPFEVKAAIDDVITTLHNQFRPTEIEIQVDCPDDLTIISVPGTLEQIMTNLMMNSLIHGFSEGKDAGSIHIAVQLTGNHLHLEYSDTGKGLQPRHHAVTWHDNL